MRTMLNTLLAVGLGLAALACGGDDDGDAGSGLDSGSQTEDTSASGIDPATGDTGGDGGSGSGVTGGEGSDVGAGDSEGYTEAVRDAFVGSCASGAGEAACECIWDAIVQNVPYDEFAAHEQAARRDASTPMPQAMVDAVASCR